MSARANHTSGQVVEATRRCLAARAQAPVPGHAPPGTGVAARWRPRLGKPRRALLTLAGSSAPRRSRKAAAAAMVFYERGAWCRTVGSSTPLRAVSCPLAQAMSERQPVSAAVVSGPPPLSPPTQPLALASCVPSPKSCTVAGFRSQATASSLHTSSCPRTAHQLLPAALVGAGACQRLHKACHAGWAASCRQPASPLTPLTAHPGPGRTA